MNLYSIHDGSAQYFLPIFAAKTGDQAKRMFIGSLGDSFPYRADFTLHHVGHFDDDTGTLTACDPPVVVLTGLSIPPSMDPRVTTGPEQQEAAE